MLETALLHFPSSHVLPHDKTREPTVFTLSTLSSPPKVNGFCNGVSVLETLPPPIEANSQLKLKNGKRSGKHKKWSSDFASSSYTDLSLLLKNDRIDEEEISISDSELSKAKSRSPDNVRRARRSSIVNHDDSIEGNNNSGSVTNVQRHVEKARKIKKSVCFADEKGMKLTKVKVMSESSSTPPFLKRSIIEKYISITSPDHSARTPRTWLTQFSQPASQYLSFRDKIESNFVSLENVITDGDIVSGTVKVKNVSFKKHVFLRVTYDKWASSEDIQGNFFSAGNTPSRFDTFEFKFEIPSNISSSMDMEDRADFCVCYRCDQGEFWDNNNGQNYSLLHEKSNNTATGSSMYTADFKPNFTGYDSLTNFRAMRHYASEISYY